MVYPDLSFLNDHVPPTPSPPPRSPLPVLKSEQQDNNFKMSGRCNPNPGTKKTDQEDDQCFVDFFKTVEQAYKDNPGNAIVFISSGDAVGELYVATLLFQAAGEGHGKHCSHVHLIDPLVTQEKADKVKLRFNNALTTPGYTESTVTTTYHVGWDCYKNAKQGMKNQNVAFVAGLNDSMLREVSTRGLDMLRDTLEMFGALQPDTPVITSHFNPHLSSFVHRRVKAREYAYGLYDRLTTALAPRNEG